MTFQSGVSVTTKTLPNDQLPDLSITEARVLEIASILSVYYIRIEQKVLKRVVNSLYCCLLVTRARVDPVRLK